MLHSLAAFLRGVNVSGKNKVPMPELKAAFEELGFTEVKTYLNSGNVSFSAEEGDSCVLTERIEAMINSRFALDIPVFVIQKEPLRDMLNNAPDWWGREDREIYDNLIFVLPPATPAEVADEIGAPKDGLEKVQIYNSAIFWAFSRKDYQKTNWWPRTADASIGPKLTIRTANTVRKLAQY